MFSRAALKRRVKRLASTSYKTRSAFNSLQDFRRRRYFQSICEDIPIDDHLVLFESFLGRQYACSPRAIYEAMKRDSRFDDYRFVWVSRRPDKLRKEIGDERTIVVKYLSRRYLRAYARAKYWVTNWRLSTALKKRPGQVVIQTWHGTPLKKIGMDLTIEGNATTSQRKGHRSYLEDAKRYDYFVSPSAFCTKVFASAFGLGQLNKEDILIETGYPRNDRLFSRREVVMPGEPGACVPHFGGLAIEKLARCRMTTIFLAAIGRNASPICPAHASSRMHPNRLDDKEHHAGDFEYQQRRGLIRLHPERPRQ